MKNWIKSVTLSAALVWSCSVLASPVNINKATADEIAENLKGIGLVKAQSIVAYREAHGEFKALQELQHVKGIGMKTIEMNQADIKFQD